MKPPKSHRRNHNRSRSRSRSRERRTIQTLQEQERKVRELEEKLRQKNISLAVGAMRFEQNFGVKVDEDYGPPPGVTMRSMAKPKENIVITISDDSDEEHVLRIDEGDDVQSVSSHSFSSNSNYTANHKNGKKYKQKLRPHSSLRYEAPAPGQNGSPPCPFAYEHPPEYQSFRHEMPPAFFRGEADVRVEEIPRWPMQEGSIGSPQFDEPQRSFSPTPMWRHQQEVQVDPMPVFPMEGDEAEPEKERPVLTREEQVRLQMKMIKEQAEKAEKESTRPSKSRRDEPRRDEPRKDRRGQETTSESGSERGGRESNERREQRAVRHKIAKYKEQALQDLKKQEKEKELKKRETEREKRHALQKKKEEEESAKRREDRRKKDEMKRAAEADEHFLKYLIPAIGDLECKATRIEGKNPTEFVSKCHAVNIPKELLYGSSVAELKEEGYDAAVKNYVDKLVALGVVDKTTRRAMKSIAKLPKMLAELVEPLCNDIAIFGTQISVTAAREMRSDFESFAKEKSAEFWAQEENKKRLSDCMRRDDRKRARSRSRSRDRKRHTDRDRERERDRRDRDRDRRTDRGRSKDRESGPTPPSNEEALKMLFAGTSAPEAPANNFYPTVPPLMSIPVHPPSYPMDPSYMQQPPSFYQPQQYHDGLLQFQQQPMMMQQPYQHQNASDFYANSFQSAMAPPPPPAPVVPQRSQEDDDAALLDEIYQM